VRLPQLHHLYRKGARRRAPRVERKLPAEARLDPSRTPPPHYFAGPSEVFPSARQGAGKSGIRRRLRRRARQQVRENAKLRESLTRTAPENAEDATRDREGSR